MSQNYKPVSARRNQSGTAIDEYAGRFLSSILNATFRAAMILLILLLIGSILLLASRGVRQMLIPHLGKLGRQVKVQKQSQHYDGVERRSGFTAGAHQGHAEFCSNISADAVCIAILETATHHDSGEDKNFAAPPSEDSPDVDLAP